MARASLRKLLIPFKPISLSIPTTFKFVASSSSSSSSSSSTSSSSSSHSSISTNTFFLNCCLQRCHSMKHLLQIQAHLITTGAFQDTVAATHILKVSSDFGDISYAVFIFSRIDSPDAFCVNTVIKAYSQFSDPGNAVVFYFEMLRRGGFFPNSYTFPPLVSSCARKGCADDGEKCHGQTVKHGVEGVTIVRNALVHMYTTCGLVECAWQLFDSTMVKDLVSWNSIVDGYAKMGDVVTARSLFDEMPKRNVVSWNVMLSGYLRGGNPGCALKLFRKMRRLGLKGSSTTMVSVVTACGRSARLKEGKSVHGFWIRNFLEPSFLFQTALVGMYCKCWRSESARRVFDGMENRNLICWNTMILGHCIQGRPEDGLALFEEMVQRGSKDEESSNGLKTKEQGLSPDEITFIGILCGCSRAQLLSEGKRHFDEMTHVYNVTPKFAHLWCMANLYGSFGLIEEAEKVLRKIPESSESILWSSLLGSCRFRGDVELGEQIAKHLIELEPKNGSYYALLWNIYAVAGQWEDVAKVKLMMKERGVGEVPGSSLLDLNKIVHEFKVGDRSRPEMEKIYMLMDELARRLNVRVESSGTMEFG